VVVDEYWNLWSTIGQRLAILPKKKTLIAGISGFDD